ncbi:hypothetical protein D918_09511 [Trichuris suis]|nr:hypothetical protein D918_09511 [Trichuris suis]
MWFQNAPNVAGASTVCDAFSFVDCTVVMVYDASKRTSYVVEVDFLARRSNRPCIVKKVANEIPIRLWAKKEAMTMTSSAAKSEKAKGHLRPLAVMSNMLYDCSFFIGNGSVHPYPPTERSLYEMS